MQIACPRCQKPLSLPAQLPGNLVKCPHCTTVLDVSAYMGPRPNAAGQPQAARPAPAQPALVGAGAATAPRSATGPSVAPMAAARPSAAMAAEDEPRRPIRRRKNNNGLIGLAIMLLVLIGGVVAVVMARKHFAKEKVTQPASPAFAAAKPLVARELSRSETITMPDQYKEVEEIEPGKWRVVGFADYPARGTEIIRQTWEAEVVYLPDSRWELRDLKLTGQRVEIGGPTTIASSSHGGETVGGEPVDGDRSGENEEPEPFKWVDTSKQPPSGADNPFGESMHKTGVEFVQDHDIRWAMERVKGEIEQSLESRKTLVVWLVDRSRSAEGLRSGFIQELSRVYGELNVRRQKGAAGDSIEEAQLLSALCLVGEEVEFPLDSPVSVAGDIEAKLNDLPEDNSGVEKVFLAIRETAEKYKSFAAGGRNVMLVLVSDEAGDDADSVDATIELLKAQRIPLSVVGARAPLGRQMVPVTNPEVPADFGQSKGGVPTLRMGPESRQSEHIALAFWNPSMGLDDAEFVDSGFGPYALQWAAQASGGNYYGVYGGGGASRVGRGYGYAATSGLIYFFDPKVMRKYLPDYLNDAEYKKLLGENKARQALVNAAKVRRVETMKFITTSFGKAANEADHKRRMDEAQKQAAVIEPKIDDIYQALKAGEADRAKLTGARWQAGYDLAMGRVLAAKARTEGYNAMLAQVKGGFKFEKESSDVMYLEPDAAASAGSAYERFIKDSRKYLERVVKEHPGTPWALLAARELEIPCGWKWKEAEAGKEDMRAGK